ncbi:hypothetical protein WDZ92_47605 [Nostoc sp. NIES-2111]
MSFGEILRASYRELQESWTRLADRTFTRSVPATRDETARGEFISAYICESGPKRPASGSQFR